MTGIEFSMLSQEGIKTMGTIISSIKNLKDLKDSLKFKKVTKDEIDQYYLPLYIELYKLQEWINNGEIKTYNFNFKEILSPEGKRCLAPELLRNNSGKWRRLEFDLNTYYQSVYSVIKSSIIGVINGCIQDKDITLQKHQLLSPSANDLAEKILKTFLYNTTENYLEMIKVLDEYLKYEIKVENLVSNNNSINEKTLILKRKQEEIFLDIKQKLDNYIKSEEYSAPLAIFIKKTFTALKGENLGELAYLEEYVTKFVTLREEISKIINTLEDELYAEIKKAEKDLAK